MKELIKIQTNEVGENCVSARELHEGLGNKRQFTDWIKQRITRYSFEENIDYIKVSLVSQNKTGRGGDTKSVDYIITIDMAIVLCRLSRNNPKSIKFIEYFQSKLGKTIEIKEQKKAEYQFGEILDKITGFTWERQYNIDGGKYRLDFYLPNILIIEYDEDYHKYQKEQDEERIRYCRDWLATHENDYDDGWRCPVIRVKKGEELQGLNRIIRHLAGFECFDTQYNYNLECCDIGNR